MSNQSYPTTPSRLQSYSTPSRVSHSSPLKQSHLSSQRSPQSHQNDDYHLRTSNNSTASPFPVHCAASPPRTQNSHWSNHSRVTAHVSSPPVQTGSYLSNTFNNASCPAASLPRVQRSPSSSRLSSSSTYHHANDQLRGSPPSNGKSFHSSPVKNITLMSSSQIPRYDDHPALSLSELHDDDCDDDQLTVQFEQSFDRPLPYDQWYEAKSLAIESELVRERQDAMRHALMVRFKQYQADRAFERWAAQKDSEADEAERRQRELDILQAQEERMLELKRSETFQAWLSRKDRQLEIERLQRNDQTEYSRQHSRTEEETAAKFDEWCRRKDAHAKKAAKAQEMKAAKNAAKLANEKAERTQRGNELYVEWTKTKDKAEKKQAVKDTAIAAKKAKVKQERKDRFDKEFKSLVSDYTSKIQKWKQAEDQARKKQAERDRPQRVHRQVAVSEKPKPKAATSNAHSKSDKQKRVVVRPDWVV